MTIDYAKAAGLLLSNDDILIISHMNPDGDTLGCAFALCRALIQKGKRARVICSDHIPSKYSYLSDGLDIQEFRPSFITTVDVADIKLLGGNLEDRYGEIINLSIDHHGSNKMFAEYNCVDSYAGAAAEIIYKVILEMGVSIDTDIANCIYTGLSTDTGCFRYSNATAQTYRIAAEMLDAGAESSSINTVMFESKSLAFLKLQQLCIDGMKVFFNDRCSVVTLTQDMYKKSGIDDTESESISSLARQVEGVYVGVTIRERENGKCKVSIRSHSPVDAAEICAKMNGGGHNRAAGCELSMSVEQTTQEVLKHIKQALIENGII
ncbi:MAG: bifunctional oligoribonuclease/PAP phosphatase NrnA [Oscillospiraceae bacterium]|jgi:phosphoesterase RecJ-like protein|nr:bifunctional oligoribonuclease/PAP phosphatase NrnA [Oscillospiraceae bacterium]